MKLTEAQKQHLSHEISCCISSDRWCIFAADLQAGPMREVESTPEIRRGGCFEPAHQHLFQVEVEAVLSGPCWVLAFASLDDAENLNTQMRAMNVRHDKRVHQAFGQFVYLAQKEGAVWSRRWPETEICRAAMARHVEDALNRRRNVSDGGIVAGRADDLPAEMVKMARVTGKPPDGRS